MIEEIRFAQTHLWRGIDSKFQFRANANRFEVSPETGLIGPVLYSQVQGALLRRGGVIRAGAGPGKPIDVGRPFEIRP
jgi:hypothetical protein